MQKKIRLKGTLAIHLRITTSVMLLGTNEWKSVKAAGWHKSVKTEQEPQR